MTTTKTLAVIFVATALAAGGSLEALGGGAGCSTGATAASYEQTLERAKTAGLPALIKVGAEWCTACQAFEKATDTAGSFDDGIAKHAVLLAVDGEKGEGAEIAKKYKVYGYPTFLLLNANGETLDRWVGYKDEGDFMSVLDGAAKDPVTVAERIARFEKNPSERDAQKIGDLRQADGLHAEACAYYRRAAQLNPSSEAHYTTMIFGAVAMGHKHALYSNDELKSQADAVFASKQSDGNDFLKVAFTMSKAAYMSKDQALFTPYLKAAVERTAKDTDAKIVENRARLLPDYAIQIEKNLDKALAYKKASMPAGWENDADQLNNFAWWCFENHTNVKEAMKLAEKGVELAVSGRQKANVLDTLAELCNQSGDCGDAVEYIRAAIKEAPDVAYFAEQLTRFEAALAAQTH